MKKICSILAVVVFILLSALPVSASTAEVPYENYIYSESDKSAIPCPQAYLPSVEIFGSTLGIGEMKAPSDIDTDDNGDIYILDTGNSRVVVLKSDLSLKKTFDCTVKLKDGTKSSLDSAQGIAITEDSVYICDTNNSRILVFNKTNGKFIKSIGTPTSSLLGEDFIFKPSRLEVDEKGNLYIVSNGVYEGILNLDSNGEFLGFFASNKVSTSAWDLFWRNFSTIEQRKKMIQLVPQDFSSIDVDDEGFFFVTTFTAVGGSMVKRVNPGGNNVIRQMSSINTAGDPTKYIGGLLEGKSSFSDIAAGPYRIYACLDKTRGRIFCYNNDGYLLYNFGILSDRIGGFTNPVAVTYLDDERIAVLDTVANSVTVFEPTEYAKSINLGVKYLNELNYDAAHTEWKKVLTQNSYYELALNMIGRSYFNNGEYEKAMEYFQKSSNSEMYSNAKKNLRSKLIYEYSWIIVAVIVVLILVLIWRFIMRLIKKNNRQYDYD